MKRYCPHCGIELVLVRLYNKYYASLLQCQNDFNLYFIEMSDTHHSYPLLNLELGVAKSLIDSKEEDVNIAFSRIKYIDYKTVSIVFFEQTLLKVYDNKEYQIVYPKQ